MKGFAQRKRVAVGVFSALFVVMAVAQASAQAPQEWQVRGICDLRKGAGSAGRGAECFQLAAEVLMLLPEKAGPGNVAVLAEFTDNLDKAGASWDAPCRDPKHCPDAAFTIRYAFISRKILTIPRDKIFTALVCREGFSDTAPDDAACRLKLMKVLREMVTRARKEGALLAVIKCGGAESEAVRPDGTGVSGYELVYAFVQLPDMLPMAGNDPRAAAKFGVDQLAGPQEAVAVSGQAKVNSIQTSGPTAAQTTGQAGPLRQANAALPAATQSAKPTGAAPAAPAVAPASSPPPASAMTQPLATGEIIMQAAALPSLVQAETVADRLSLKGIEASFEQAEVNGREVYRVLARGTGSPEAFRQKLAEMGYPGAIQRR